MLNANRGVSSIEGTWTNGSDGITIITGPYGTVFGLSGTTLPPPVRFQQGFVRFLKKFRRFFQQYIRERCVRYRPNIAVIPSEYLLSFTLHSLRSFMVRNYIFNFIQSRPSISRKLQVDFCVELQNRILSKLVHTPCKNRVLQLNF